MKNKYEELKRKLQKLNGKSRRRGFYSPYDWSGRIPGRKTFWEDMFVWINGIEYFIAFVHPRMRYMDVCDNLVWDKMYPSRPASEASFVPHRTKKVGKSRKKVVTYVMTETEGDALAKWHGDVARETELTYTNSDVVVKPSVRVLNRKRTKTIDICVPYEVQSESDAKFLAEMIRNHYIAGSLYEWVGKMSAIMYDKDSYKRENKQ